MLSDTAPTDTGTSIDLPRSVGDGLVMRRAKLSDRERVADFHANTLLDIGEIGPLDHLHGFVLDLMSGSHPTFNPEDFILVENTATGAVVSSMCLISQTWSYEGVSFPFGQPEIVSTDPAYRRRGLVRAQIEEVHKWSAARGELVQGITGIPWYYRQFGYEMALNLDGNKQCPRWLVPRLKDGEEEPFSFRRATLDDLSFVREMYGRAMSRSLIAAVREEPLWRYDLEGRNETNGIRAEFRVIETPDGRPAGLLLHSRRLWGSALGVRLCEPADGVPYLALMPSVLRYLDNVGQEFAARDSREFTAISFNFGEAHPVYNTLGERLPLVSKPYAWYIRVPDLPAFVSRIAPALEQRLAASPQAGYTGEIALNFYRDGLRFKFEKGALAVEGWKPGRVEEGNAAFPDLTFLKLLFGYRSVEELLYAYPDCSVTGDAGALLPVLFPKKPSQVWVGG